MVIIRVIGGLGNQFFQYAYALKIKELGYDVKLDLKYLKKSGGVVFLKYFQSSIREEKNQVILSIYRALSFFFNNKFYLKGYWQNSKYFPNEDLLKEELSLKFKKSDYCKKMISEIKQSNSVSLHIRRGDYLTIDNKKIYYNLSNDYYNNAISLIMSKVSSPIFYIFSNDIEWAKNNFTLNNAIFIENNSENKDIEEFYLMSNCKFNIIANSTFSWWAAYLNTFKKKIVVGPKNWFIEPNKFEDFDYRAQNLIFI